MEDGGAVEKMLLHVDARVRKASKRVNKPSYSMLESWPLRSPDSKAGFPLITWMRHAFNEESIMVLRTFRGVLAAPPAEVFHSRMSKPISLARTRTVDVFPVPARPVRRRIRLKCFRLSTIEKEQK